MNPKKAIELIRAHHHSDRAMRLRYQKYLDWYLANNDTIDRDQDELDTGSGEEDLVLDTNFPYAYIDTMVAGVCPTNPQITIQAGHPDLAKPIRNRERLVNSVSKRMKLYKKGWRVAAHAAVAGAGITKIVWDLKRESPRVRNIDPRRIIWDQTVDEWDDIKYIAEALVLTRDEFKARTKRVRLPDGGFDPPRYKPSVSEKANFGPWPDWLKGADVDSSRQAKLRGVFDYVVVWEFYDFVGGNYWHLLEDVPEPLLADDRLPYRFVRNPYDHVAFNDNLHDTRGISDIRLIERAQERLNEIDAIELQHAHRTMQTAVVDKTGVSDPEALVDALQDVENAGSIIEVELANGRRSINDVVSYTQSPTLSPSFDKMREKSSTLIEFLLALPSFARGAPGDFRHATEAALADTGYRTRNGKRIVVMGEWQSSIARKILGLYAEMWNPQRLIPIRDSSAPTAELLTIEDFAFEDDATMEEDWYMLVEAAPFSPAENHRMVVLQKLQQWAPILFEHPNVNKSRLMKLLLEALMMVEVFEDAADQPAQPVPGQPGAPGQSGMRGNDAAENPEAAEMLQSQTDEFTGRFSAPGVDEARAGG